MVGAQGMSDKLRDKTPLSAEPQSCDMEHAQQWFADQGKPSLKLDYVPLGTVYKVETDSVAKGTLICGGCKKHISIRTVWASGGITYSEGIMPLELFEFDEGASEPR